MDIVQGQGQRAQILICSDMNARTAEEEDNVQIFDLSDIFDLLEDVDQLPHHMQHKRTVAGSWTITHGVQSSWTFVKRRICAL